jgi:hypothetical protein
MTAAGDKCRDPPPDSQAEVLRFLRDPAHYGGASPVAVVETHGAYVFLAGAVALKVKRAIRYEYMDLSTPGRRRRMLQREFALNRRTAPGIYRDVVPVTRVPGGGLALNGGGRPVEWVLRMRRFAAADELAVIAARGDFTDALADDLGRSVQAYHHRAPRRSADGTDLINAILDELDRAFAGMHAELGAAPVAAFHTAARTQLAACAVLLTGRSVTGHVRRCHGDLHLRNLVLLDGVPTPFDALEFSETLGTCDVLYDLAFLIMDLRHRKLPRAANIVLNSYLLAATGKEDTGLVALPLFVAVRAAIRAMVGIQARHAGRGSAPGAGSGDARHYLQDALAALAPAPPQLVAVGGLSGSGKTTLSRELAPLLGAAPGAVHLRSDIERKAMAGVAPLTRLPVADYAREGRGRVYARLLERAGTLLRAGQAVLLDATFLDPSARAKAATLSADLGVPFTGLWLQAPAATLMSRLAARQGDASDADAAVLRLQLATDPGPIGWQRLDSSRNLAAALAAARAMLSGGAGLSGGGG